MHGACMDVWLRRKVNRVVRKKWEEDEGNKAEWGGVYKPLIAVLTKEMRAFCNHKVSAGATVDTIAGVHGHNMQGSHAALGEK